MHAVVDERGCGHAWGLPVPCNCNRPLPLVEEAPCHRRLRPKAQPDLFPSMHGTWMIQVSSQPSSSSRDLEPSTAHHQSQSIFSRSTTSHLPERTSHKATSPYSYQLHLVPLLSWLPCPCPHLPVPPRLYQHPRRLPQCHRLLITLRPSSSPQQTQGALLGARPSSVRPVMPAALPRCAATRHSHGVVDVSLAGSTACTGCRESLERHPGRSLPSTRASPPSRCPGHWPREHSRTAAYLAVQSSVTCPAAHDRSSMNRPPCQTLGSTTA